MHDLTGGLNPGTNVERSRKPCVQLKDCMSQFGQSELDLKDFSDCVTTTSVLLYQGGILDMLHGLVARMWLIRNPELSQKNNGWPKHSRRVVVTINAGEDNCLVQRYAHQLVILLPQRTFLWS